MQNLKNMSDYTLIGTLHADENIEVLIAFKEENTPDNLYIMNKIPFIRKNMEIFKSFFFCFNSKNKIKDFEDLFVLDKNFYAVFKYKNCENIKSKFSKELCVTVFEERCVFLEKILMKLNTLSILPIGALACITDPKNISIDSEKKIYITYNFSNIFKNENYSMADVYKNIGNIIFTILQVEAEVKYNKALHIVLDKCKNGVYSSIPELTVDLKRAEKISKSTSLLSYLKYQLSLRQNIITKATEYAAALAVVFGLTYLGYRTITKNTQPAASVQVVSIGDINYTGDSEDESDKEISTEKKSVQKEAVKNEINLSPGLDIEYEDYIIQYGDTISSICESYYKDTNLESAVASFNNLTANEKLVAGSLIKLPNKTAIALYTSN